MEKNESVDDDDGFSQSALYVCVFRTNEDNQMFSAGHG